MLAFLTLVWDAAAIGALGWIVAHGGQAPVLPSQISHMPPGAALAAIHIAFLGLIAPVTEELFFRGWLWSALRKTWSPARTMTWTTGLWLAMHFMDGTWRPFLLLPTGILLGLARHYGDSVRASLTLHLINNGMVVLIHLAALLLAGQPGAG
jgi:membrane protease YdiL (CAAX protease family)